MLLHLKYTSRLLMRWFGQKAQCLWEIYLHVNQGNKLKGRHQTRKSRRVKKKRQREQ